MSHDVIYDAAALYDLAFSYRDFARETEFLSKVYERRRRRPPRSFLELAAGPADHAIAMLERGVQAAALDLAPTMATHGARKAAARGLTLPYVTDDMVTFTLERSFDLVACMLCSATYLMTDEAFITHLKSVAGVLPPDGLYVLELPHPSELSGVAKTKDEWTVRDAGGQLDVEWSELDGTLDPVARTKVCSVRLRYQPVGGGAPIVVEDEARQRGFSRADIEALVAASGCFEIDGVFGALDESIALDAEKAWRMLVVLGRK